MTRRKELTDPPATREPVDVMSGGRRVRVCLEPNKPVAATLPRESVPRFGLVNLAMQGDGRFLPIVTNWSGTVRLTEDLPAKLGIDCSVRTMYRLIKAGFITGRQIAPGTILMDLGSFVAHIEAAADPEFWTNDRKRRYRETLV